MDLLQCKPTFYKLS